MLLRGLFLGVFLFLYTPLLLFLALLPAPRFFCGYLARDILLDLRTLRWGAPLGIGALALLLGALSLVLRLGLRLVLALALVLALVVHRVSSFFGFNNYNSNENY